MRQPHAFRASRARWAPIAVVLLVAAALRMPHLGTESVWLDEAFAIRIARGSLTGIVAETSRDVHPPLYYALLHYWLPLAGRDEGSARLLSAILSVATIAASYALAMALFGRRIALFTAAILAVSPFQVEFAQEARMYSLLALLSVLSMTTFVSLVRRWTAPWYLAYLGLTTAMLYTQIYAFFTLGAQMVTLAVLWLRHPRTGARVIRPWLGAATAIAVFFSPWAQVLARQTSRVQSAFWIPPPHWLSGLQPFYTFAGSVPLTIILTPFAVVGIALIVKRAVAGHPVPAALLLPWFLTPIVMPLLISLVSSSIFLPKYAIAASLPLAMFTAVGLDALPRPRWRAVVGIAVAAAAAVRLFEFYTLPQKDGWRDAAATIERAARPGDVVLFYKDFNQIAYDFYRTRTDLIERPFPYRQYLEVPDAATLDVLAPRAVRNASRIWFVVLTGEPAGPAILDSLRRVRQEVEHLTAPHLDIYLFVAS